MLLPDGLDAGMMDRIMLLSIWAKFTDNENFKQKLIYAGMGKPTFRINPFMVQSYLTYWQHIQTSLSEMLNQDIDNQNAINYGDPRGETQALDDMAQALSRWYASSISTKDLLFTVGGSGALKVIFETFNETSGSRPYRVITPFPYYSLYASGRHVLHPINIMDEPGYRLTLSALQSSISSAYKASEKDNIPPKILLLCNPNNPLGTVLSEQELEHVATLLRENPDLQLVIDEAYAEMVWLDKKPLSILELAPDIKDRVTILRSATKAHSAAGERMAVLINFNPEQMKKYQIQNISMIGHAPRSAQLAYASTMNNFGEKEAQELREFYEPRLRFAQFRLHEMDALMPDKEYKTDGTFYVMTDLSDLMGMDIPQEAEAALGYSGKITTSEELIYSLLFQESIMIAPGQYFGLSAQKGYCRITCSGSQTELNELLDRLDNCLLVQRLKKKDELIVLIEQCLERAQSSPEITNQYKISFEQIKKDSTIHAELVVQNKSLSLLLFDIQNNKLLFTQEDKNQVQKNHHSFFDSSQSEDYEEKLKKETDHEWSTFIDEFVSEGLLKNLLISLPENERMSFKPWAQKRELQKEDSFRHNAM